jgi:hypothetical protein
MSSITSQKVGKHTYLYIFTSIWDPIYKINNNKKTKIGKIDLETGEPVFIENL